MNLLPLAIDGCEISIDDCDAAIAALHAVDLTGLAYAEPATAADSVNAALRVFGWTDASGITANVALPRSFTLGGIYSDFVDDHEAEVMLAALAPFFTGPSVVVMAESRHNPSPEFAFVIEDGRVSRDSDVDTYYSVSGIFA